MNRSRRDAFQSTQRFRRWLRSELTHALALVEQASPERNNPALEELGEVIIKLDVRLLPLLISSEAARGEYEERKRARQIAIREGGLEPAIRRLNQVIGSTAGSFAETRIPIFHRRWIDMLLSRLLDLLSHANPVAFYYDSSQEADDVDADERIPGLIAALREIFPETNSA